MPKTKKYKNQVKPKENNNTNVRNVEKNSLQIICERNSGRAVGRIIGINRATIHNWIKKHILNFL